MCYPRPGPRCSGHATKRLDRARARLAKDPDNPALILAVERAYDEYLHTPAGIRELEASPGRKSQELAAHYRDRRKAMINSYKASKAGDVTQRVEDLILRTAEALIKKHTALYGEPIGQGRTRVVYDRGDGTVVKIPLSWQGCRDNSQEAGWDAEETGIPIARCYTQEVDGIPLLVMEKVTPITDHEEMPLWASRVDCYQVGINSAGYAVAYDL